jgi:hypothetical protein
MYMDTSTREPLQNAGAARRKNGHKPGCRCHICENIRMKEKRGEYGRKKTISRKANGHKENCMCPICKNMRNMKKGGSKTMRRHRRSPRRKSYKRYFK